ncbi:hypothetical protein [Enterobacter cloacae]|uniref:hypothetical protein n=1 Tax=Enterobacter cloacae TaxID=550 RepID=UPI00388D2A99
MKMKRLPAVKMISLKRLAVSARENLDDVFKALTAKCMSGLKSQTMTAAMARCHS